MESIRILPIFLSGTLISSGDHGCGDEQDAGRADGEGQDVLQFGGGFRAHDVDHGDEHREDDGRGQPGGVDIESGDRIQVALQELRPHVGDDGRQRARLEAYDAHIAEDDGPGADERADRPHGPHAEHVLATAFRHGGRQFGVGHADEEDHHAAEDEAQHGADDAGRADPVAGGNHPSPSDHGAEGDHQDVHGTEGLVEIRICSCMCFHRRSFRMRPVRWHRRAVLTPRAARRIVCYSFSISTSRSRYWQVFSQPSRLLSMSRSRWVRSPRFVPVMYWCRLRLRSSL